MTSNVNMFSIFILLLCLATVGTCLPADKVVHNSKAVNATNETVLTADKYYHDLVRRQCVWDATKNDWKCDLWLPSLSQIIDHNQNSAEGGLSNIDHSVVFFTGLNVAMDNMCTVVAHWASAQRLSYCWYESCSNWGWFDQQEAWAQTALLKPQVFRTFGSNPLRTHLQCVFQALALSVVNKEAYLLIKDGTMWDKASNWGKCA